MNNSSLVPPFLVKSCALSAIATGERASSLIELRDKIATAPERCIYYHFWGSRMNPQFAHPQHHNDFASWVYSRLHDHILAEKLNIIDPMEYNSLEELRQDLLEVIDRRLDDYEFVVWTKKEDRFHFIYSHLVIFESALSIPDPQQLPKFISQIPPNSIFFHFIDAKSRTPKKIDDFSTWLGLFGEDYRSLIEDICGIDPFFLSLTKLKEELSDIIHKHLG